jgi:uncharacterized protein
VRIGLISDTHGQLRPEVLTHFEGVDLILHAGDIGSEDVLTDLEALAPVTAVHGNMDGFPLRSTAPERARLELEGRHVVVVHGHAFGSPTPDRLAAAFPGADIVVYGHTHQPLEQRVGSTLLVNPGAAGPARFELRPSVALLELRDRAEEPAEVVRFIEL